MCGEEGGERAVAETACADQKRRILGDPAVSRSRSSSSLTSRPASRPPTSTLTSSFTMSCGNPQTEPDALMQRKLLLACVSLA